MKYIVYAILSLLIISLVWSISTFLGPSYLVIGLPLLVCIAIAMEYQNNEYIAISLIAGFILETFFGLPLGSLIVGYLLAGLISTLVFKQISTTGSNLKYYLGLVMVADLLLIIWLQLYTWLLFSLDVWHFRLIAGQLWYDSWKMLLTHLIFAVPVYSILIVLVRIWQQNRRHNLNIT